MEVCVYWGKECALIQMFQKMKIIFTGKGSLKALSQFEVVDSPRILQAEALILAMYVNELVIKLLHEQDAYPKLFNFYQEFVGRVGVFERQQQRWLLRLFENNLLAELGYQLNFLTDVDEAKIEPKGFYQYRHQLGFVRDNLGKISGDLLLKLAQQDMDNQPNLVQLKICRDLNRQRLAFLLGNQDLKSRSLFFYRK
jgi:DNA repair protein RecO (recombination protein O)